MEPLSAFTRVFNALWQNPEFVSPMNIAPYFAEPVIGRRYAPTRRLHAGYHTIQK
jgi:hypothetical protein